MTDIVIGTAGHIDHGKTTLIKALTGMETDTTKEEKTRGLSINLGFAYLDLPNKERVGIVDVPGHEKFIKNMIAGLPGIDLILLVIDSSEGIMAQTKEHIDILTLLGIKHFIIVLTKCETVDEELKELVKDDIKEQLKDTVLKDADMIETDALEDIGMDELVSKIQAFTDSVTETPLKDAGRLNVDRVFSVKGFGTVVTGTMLDGSFKLGEELTLFPNGNKAKIRNIQIHETNQNEAKAGQRTALNLTNVSKTDIARGDVLSNVDSLVATWMLDTKITCLKTSVKGLQLWDRVRVLIGTREVFARLVPIGAEQIGPGEEGFVQLRLEEQLAVKSGDYFIVRAYSPMVTIGGGQILDANPLKHRRFKQDIVDSLKIKEEGTLDTLILDFILNKQEPITAEKEIEEYLNQDDKTVQKLLEEMKQQQAIIHLIGKDWIHPARLIDVREAIYTIVNEYHKKHRLRVGMPIEEIRSKMNVSVTNKQFDSILNQLVENEELQREANYLAHPDFHVTFNSYQLEAQKKIETKLEQSGFTPLKKEDLILLDKNAEDVLEALENKTVIFLTYEYVILKKYYEQSIDLIKTFILENDEMTLGDFRDLTQSSRKSSMLILEYIDDKKITKRVENKRVLGEAG